MAQASNVVNPWSEQAVQESVKPQFFTGPSFYAEMNRVRGLRPAPGASLKEIVNSWPLSPVSFCADNPSAETPSSVRGSTQETTGCLRSTILCHPGATIRFNADWVAADVERFGDIALHIHPAFDTSRWLQPFHIAQSYYDRLGSESPVTSYLCTQLRDILEYAVFLVCPPSPGKYYFFGLERNGGAYRTDFGTTKPDLLFTLGDADALMTGEIKLPVVMSLSVMRWIVWWARKTYRLQVDMPPDLKPEQSTALRILRQVWGQQVGKQARRLFLSNGDYFIFFSAQFPRPTDSCISHIYSYSGEIDSYDGSLPPSTAVNRFVPVAASWPHAPGLLIALAVAAVHSIEVDGPWPELPEDPGLGQGARASTYTGPRTRSATRLGPRIRMSNRAALQGLHFAVPALFKPGPRSQLTHVSLLPALPTRIRSDFYTPEGTPTLIDSAMSEPSSPDQVVPGTSDVGDMNITFEALLGSGSFADVFSGTLTPSDQSSTSSGVIHCAFKFIHSDTFKRSNWGHEGRPCTSKTAIPTLRAEAAVLLTLTETLAVPRFYGYWEGTDIGGRPYAFIAMERLAGAASSSMDESDKHAVIRMLDRLHRAGVVTGDLELRHILRTLTAQPGDDGWRIIDLERARKASNEGAAAELRSGYWLLEMVPPPALTNVKVDRSLIMYNEATTNEITVEN